MIDTIQRYVQNPLLLPEHIRPSMDGLVVECVLNPGAFRFAGKIGLLLRVAERPVQDEASVKTVVIDPAAPGGQRILAFQKDDPDLVSLEEDSRGFVYRGQPYLTTLSHLRLAWSEDGLNFRIDPTPTLLGRGELEAFGVEDCRVTEIDGTYYLTYTAVSVHGFGVGLISTTDWEHFMRHGMILPPNNKDCALFPRKIGEHYFALHRPTMEGAGRNQIWLAQSPNLLHWGQHRTLIKTRPGMWDSARVGAGDAPIWTGAGWLEIYHGADENNRYCLGALLLDLNDPSKVLARSDQPIMEPIMEYEKVGFFGSVVFTNGMVVEGDRILMYYGASDQVVCGATLSLREILASLHTL